MTLSRDALRPWATSAAVNRALRAMLAADAHQLGAEHGARVFLVLLGGAFVPESIPADAWRSVEGYRVAVVGLEVARDIATGRSSSAADALARPPPPRGAWVLALAPDGSSLTWSTPVAFLPPPVGAPSPAAAESSSAADAPEAPDATEDLAAHPVTGVLGFAPKAGRT